MILNDKKKQTIFKSIQSRFLYVEKRKRTKNVPNKYLNFSYFFFCVSIGKRKKEIYGKIRIDIFLLFVLKSFDIVLV